MLQTRVQTSNLWDPKQVDIQLCLLTAKLLLQNLKLPGCLFLYGYEWILHFLQFHFAGFQSFPHILNGFPPDFWQFLVFQHIFTCIISFTCTRNFSEYSTTKAWHHVILVVHSFVSSFLVLHPQIFLIILQSKDMKRKCFECYSANTKPKTSLLFLRGIKASSFPTSRARWSYEKTYNFCCQ